MRARDAARKAAPGTVQRKLREDLNAYGNEILDRVLSDYAHELAEKIREHFIPRPPGRTAHYINGLDDGLDAAADLIDPEVEK